MKAERRRAGTDLAPVEVAGGRKHQAEWRTVMRTIGRRVRRVRDFLGMSQEQVATLAGVSQGAVSRLEAGQALSTPLIVVLGIHQALTNHLRRMDPTLLDPEIRRVLELTELLESPLGDRGPLTADASLEQVIRLFRDVPETQREPLLAILRAAADGLTPG